MAESRDIEFSTTPEARKRDVDEKDAGIATRRTFEAGAPDGKPLSLYALLAREKGESSIPVSGTVREPGSRSKQGTGITDPRLLCIAHLADLEGYELPAFPNYRATHEMIADLEGIESQISTREASIKDKVGVTLDYLRNFSDTHVSEFMQQEVKSLILTAHNIKRSMRAYSQKVSDLEQYLDKFDANAGLKTLVEKCNEYHSSLMMFNTNWEKLPKIDDDDEVATPIERIVILDLPSERDESHEIPTDASPFKEVVELPTDFIDALGEIHIHGLEDDFRDALEALKTLYAESCSDALFDRAVSYVEASEIKKIILYSKNPFLDAVKYQMNRFRVSPAQFLRLRKAILEYNPTRLNRKHHPFSLSKWENHCKKNAISKDDFNLFGRPRAFLEAGPDVAVILAALDIGTADEPYAPLEKPSEAYPSLVQKFANLTIEDFGSIFQIIGTSHFGSIFEIIHKSQRICVKELLVSEMAKNANKGMEAFLDYGPSEVQNHRYLCQIDLSAKRARLPIPFILDFIGAERRPKTKDIEEAILYEMELGEDILHTAPGSDNIQFDLYDEMRREYLKQHQSNIIEDPGWTLRKENMSDWERMNQLIILQIAFGVWFMHERGVAHNDIKNNNAVIGMYDNRAKVMDFGQSIRFSKNDPDYMYSAHQGCGAPECSSPEAWFVQDDNCALNIACKKKFSCEKNDVWTLGYTAFTLLLMMNPFKARSNMADPYFLYITGGSYLTPDQRKKLNEKALERKKVNQRFQQQKKNCQSRELLEVLVREMKEAKQLINQKYEGECFSKMKGSEIDFDMGIYQILQKLPKNYDRDDVNRNRHLFITSDAIKLLHRVFVPEPKRITAREFILDPYFDYIRPKVIQDIENWQQQKFGMHDQILENLLNLDMILEIAISGS